MEELKNKTDAELYERRGVLAAEAEKPDADLDAIETEMKAINAELETRRAAKQAEEDALRAAEEDRKAEEAKRAEMRKLVAEGAGEPIKIFTEERKQNKMDLKEIRKSPAYVDAWVKGIKTDNYTECRKLLTENAPELNIAEGDGIVPVPAYVEDRIRALFADNSLLNRVRRTFYRGNLKVGFEVSSTGATVHPEGGDAIDDEQLIIGVCEMIPSTLKKSIALSTEVIDMRGQEFLDYVFDEFVNKIEALLVEGFITILGTAPTTSTTSAVGVPEIEASAVTLDIVAQMLAEMTGNNANPVLIMNRGTYAAFRAAQLNANYAVDPFEGCEIFYSNDLPAVADATTSDVWLIAVDPQALHVNFPAGSDVKFTYDPYTLAKQDLVQITGRMYAAIALTTPGYACRVVVGE